MQRAAGISSSAVAIAAVLAVAIAGALLIMLRPRTARDIAPSDDDYSKAILDAQKVDPKWLRYDELSRFKTGFNEACGVALDAHGQVLVAGDSGIRVFSSAGQLIRRIDLPEAAYCVRAGADELIYAGVGRHVEVFSADGVRQATWKSLEGKAAISALAVGSKEVFVADAGQRRVWRYDLQGQLTGELQARAQAPRRALFLVPNGRYFCLALSPDEKSVWVANPGQFVIQEYALDGSLLSQWGQPSVDLAGFCPCCNPCSFALLPGGGFVTAEKGLPRVKIYKANGDFDCVVAAPDSFAEDTKGIDVAVDGAGQVFVLDPAAREVRLYRRRL